MQFRDQTRRVRRRKRKREPLFRCGKCGKGYANPLGHTCGGGGDFAKRRGAQAREAAAAKRKAARKKRHDYHRCRDADCQRIACQAYREGVLNCPRSHVGD